NGVPSNPPAPQGQGCAGGGKRNGAGSCIQCLTGGDCSSGVCIAGVCQNPTCSDNVKNGTETDKDCGGTCPKCADGKGCNVAADCVSGLFSRGRGTRTPPRFT